MCEKSYYLEFWGYVEGTPEAEEAWKAKQKHDNGVKFIDAPNVFADIQPYRSQIDGSMIESRSKHRNHLKQHGCIEVGNEIQKTTASMQPKGLKEELIKQVYGRG